MCVCVCVYSCACSNVCPCSLASHGEQFHLEFTADKPAACFSYRAVHRRYPELSSPRVTSRIAHAFATFTTTREKQRERETDICRFRVIVRFIINDALALVNLASLYPTLLSQKGSFLPGYFKLLE